MFAYLHSHSRLSGGIFLAVVAALSLLAAVEPQGVLATFNFDEDRYFLPLVGTAATLGGGALLGIVALLGNWLFRSLRSFRRLSVKTRATVTVEFLLVVPLVAIAFLTVFAFAEVAHAQLMFRYAAFSAARAGSVVEKVIDIPQILNGFTIDDDARARMRNAAAYAMAGVDSGRRIRENKYDKVDNGVIKDLTELLLNFEVDGSRLTGFGLSATGKTKPWGGRSGNNYNLFGERMRIAASRLADNFEVRGMFNRNDDNILIAGSHPGDLQGIVDNLGSIAGEMGGNLGDTLIKYLKDAVTDKIKEKMGGKDGEDKYKDMFDSISGVAGHLGDMVTSIVPIPGLDKLIVEPLKERFQPLFDKLLTPITDLLEKLTGMLGDILAKVLSIIGDTLRNPAAAINWLTYPPAVNVNMTYYLPMRPGSLLWLYAVAAPEHKGCIILKRNDGYIKGKTSRLFMQTSGQRVEMPLFPLPPLILNHVSFFIGDCSFESEEDEEKKDEPDEKKDEPPGGEETLVDPDEGFNETGGEFEDL